MDAAEARELVATAVRETMAATVATVRTEVRLGLLADGLLTPGDMEGLTGACRQTVDKWVADGVLPAPIKVGGRKYWLRTAVDKWLRARAER